MPNGQADSGDLFTRESRHREELLTAFEEEWFAGPPPDLADFVRRFLPPWLPHRESIVAELIRVDQEFRIKRGETAPTENYLARLACRPSREELLELVVGEFNLRSRFQVPPAPAEFADRFPDLANDLRCQLTRRREAASLDTPLHGHGAVLHVTAGPHRGTAIRLEPGRPLLLGRSAAADLRFDADRHLSRFHVRLELLGDRVRFRDMNSRNGTSLNGQVVAAGELRPGDVLHCGETELVSGVPADATLELPKSTPGDDTNRWQPPGYELVDVLGCGTLGTTFLARRAADGTDAAVKRIETRRAATRMLFLIRETAEVRRLADSVPLLPIDLGLADGRPYVATKYHRAVPFEEIASGKSMADRFSIAARITLRLLASLAPLHAAGFVHGDIKPSNVLLKPSGEDVRVRLADFGLARCFLDDLGESSAAADVLAVGVLLRRFCIGEAGGQLPKAVELASRRVVSGQTTEVGELVDALRRESTPPEFKGGVKV